MGQIAERLRNFSLTALSLLLPVAFVIAQEPTPLWTDTIRSADGNFAVSIDPETKTVNVFRSDDLDSPSPELRVVLLRAASPEREIRLTRLNRPGSPLRYQGEDPSWDGKLTGFRVEWSRDAKVWKTLVPRGR